MVCLALRSPSRELCAHDDERTQAVFERDGFKSGVLDKVDGEDCFTVMDPMKGKIKFCCENVSESRFFDQGDRVKLRVISRENKDAEYEWADRLFVILNWIRDSGIDSAIREIPDEMSYA